MKKKFLSMMLSAAIAASCVPAVMADNVDLGQSVIKDPTAEGSGLEDIAAVSVTKTYGDEPFQIELPDVEGIKLTSSDTDILTVDEENYIHIVGVGKAAIVPTILNAADENDVSAEDIISIDQLDAVGIQVNKKEVTAGAVNVFDKQKDDTSSAIISAAAIAVDGVVGDDEVYVTTEDAAAEFSSSELGTDIDVAITGLKLAGADADKYTLNDTTASAKANIVEDLTAEMVAGKITSIYQPKGMTELNLPKLPEGFTAEIKSTSDSSVISADMAVVSPAEDKEVDIVLTISREVEKDTEPAEGTGGEEETDPSDTTGDGDTTEPSDTTGDDTTEPTDTTGDNNTTDPSDTTGDNDTTDPSDTTGDNDTTDPSDTTGDNDTTDPTDTTGDNDTTDPSDTTGDNDTTDPSDTTDDGNTTDPTDEPATVIDSADTQTITVKVSGVGEAAKITITTETSGGSGTVTGGGEYNFGDTVTLTANGRLSYWMVDGEKISESNPYVFTAEKDVTVTAYFRKTGGGSLNTQFEYKTITFVSNGGSKVDSIRVARNTAAKAPADPTRAGYKFLGWYSDKELTQKYSFNERVFDDMTLYAAWEKVAGQDEAALPFTDVRTSDWYYKAVEYMYNNDIMQGMTATRFEPDTTLTRAMFVTVLYRTQGEPNEGTRSGFADVDSGSWYAKAVAWAVKEGITAGYDENTFAPNDTITREQMAAMIYRFAKDTGYDMSGAADISGFADSEDVSDWALAAVKWAVDVEILSGMSNDTLEPKGTATRAQCASILMRCIENLKLMEIEVEE